MVAAVAVIACSKEQPAQPATEVKAEVASPVAVEASVGNPAAYAAWEADFDVKAKTAAISKLLDGNDALRATHAHLGRMRPRAASW